MMNGDPPITRLLDGLVPAAHTPFAGGAGAVLRPDLVACQARRLAGLGARTVFICGSTGEFSALTLIERQHLFDAWGEASRATGLRVVAHIGGTCTADSRDLGRRALDCGLAAISALAPYYVRPGSISELIDWCREITADAGGLPFYYYHLPALTGVRLPMDQLIDQAPERMPGFAGIKFADSDLQMFARCLDTAPDGLELAWGVDELLLPALVLGAGGSVGSTHNFCFAHNQRLCQAAWSGDHAQARRLQSRLNRAIDLLGRIGYVGAAKAVMDRLGLPLGPARLPARQPSPLELTELWPLLDPLNALDAPAPEPAMAAHQLLSARHPATP